MTDIPFALDLIHNPEARAAWERAHADNPALIERMRQQAPLRSSALPIAPHDQIKGESNA
jgi:hypothetical protein